MIKKAIALLSGGLDSTVGLSLALEEYEVSLIITFDYGQKAAECETLAASKVARYYNIPIKIMTLGWLKDITSTALVHKNKNVPNISAEDIDQNRTLGINSAKDVWVPNRNGLFLNIAATYAEAKDIDHIIFGGNREEAVTFPDNSKEFMDVANQFFSYSTLNKIKVITPVMEDDKIAIIKKLKDKEILNFVWSCYNGESIHCDNCESCSRLKRALIKSGYPEIWEAKVSHAVKTH